MPRSCLAVSLAVMCALGVSLWATAAPGGESVTFKSADSAVNTSIPATLYRPRALVHFQASCFFTIVAGSIRTKPIGPCGCKA